MTIYDNIIIDRLDFFRGEITQNRFQNELVVVLVIEPGKEWLSFHELCQSVIVVPNAGSLTGLFVLETKEPIESKDLAVKDINVIRQRYHLLKGFPNTSQQGLSAHLP